MAASSSSPGATLNLLSVTSALATAQSQFDRVSGTKGSLTLREASELLNSAKLRQAFFDLTNVDIPKKSDKEIGALFKKVDTDKSGTLSRSEFLVLCGTLVRERVQDSPLVLAEALLGLIDVDRNGRIDGAELRAVLGKLGIPTPLLLTISDSVGIDYRSLLQDLEARMHRKPSGSRKPVSGAQGGELVKDDFRSPVYTLIAALLLSYLVIHRPGGLSSLPVPPLDFTLHLGSRALPDWWQVLSSGFALTSFEHLAETAFLAYIFGRVVERAHGIFGIWMFYLSAVVGANMMALFVLPPQKVALSLSSASAGAFGLFVAANLSRIFRKPLEVLCLGPFVFTLVSQRFHNFSGQVLYLTGAGAGAMLMWLIICAAQWIQGKITELNEKSKKLASAKKKAR